MAEALQFDQASHAYTLGGRKLPSVTQVLSILDQYEGVPLAALEAAREFGTHVHLAVEIDIAGTLDEAALDPALAPYLAGWRKFRRETGAEILASEIRIHDPVLGYAGTADVLAVLRGARTTIDIKSGQVPRTVGPQTAAYAKPLESRARCCLQLLPNDYRLHRLTNPADWSVFVSCLNVWNWRNRK